jgi:preprotein translocase subunit SecD
VRRAALAVAALAIDALLIVACQATPSTEPTPTGAVEHAYSICPAGGQLPAAEVTDGTITILRDRLVRLGVVGPTFKLGDCLEVQAPAATDDASVQAAVLGTGLVTIVPVAAGVDGVKVGGGPPDGVQPLVESADITAAEVGTRPDTGLATLVIHLSDVGSAALAGWTRVHVGDRLALVVDGVAIALPTVSEPITNGQIEIAFTGDALPIPLRTIVAMIESGPLPPEWAQPERPQG